MWSSSTPKTSAGAAWHVPKPSFNHVEGQTGNKDTAPQDYNALKHAVRNQIKPLCYPFRCLALSKIKRDSLLILNALRLMFWSSWQYKNKNCHHWYKILYQLILHFVLGHKSKQWNIFFVCKLILLLLRLIKYRKAKAYYMSQEVRSEAGFSVKSIRYRD